MGGEAGYEDEAAKAVDRAEGGEEVRGALRVHRVELLRRARFDQTGGVHDRPDVFQGGGQGLGLGYVAERLLGLEPLEE